jgi:hypothetical protein
MKNFGANREKTFFKTETKIKKKKSYDHEI